MINDKFLIVRNSIEEVFKNSGIMFEYDENNDADLSTYVDDSIHFISIVVSLEEKLNIEFPDEMLTLEGFQSINALTNALLSQI